MVATLGHMARPGRRIVAAATATNLPAASLDLLAFRIGTQSDGDLGGVGGCPLLVVPPAGLAWTGGAPHKVGGTAAADSVALDAGAGGAAPFDDAEPGGSLSGARRVLVVDVDGASALEEGYGGDAGVLGAGSGAGGAGRAVGAGARGAGVVGVGATP